MTTKPPKERAHELEELIDLENLPELVEDDTPGVVIDIADTLDIQEPPALSDDGDALIDIEVPIEEEWADDGWSSDARNDASEAEDLFGMDDGMEAFEEKANGGPDDDGTLLDELLIEEEEPPPADDDNGLEGPISKETFEIDTAEWDTLDETEDPDEDIYETMNRLELSLEIEDDAPKQEEPPPELWVSADVSYLGPVVGDLFDVLFHGGAPIGVGDGIYLSGADQMLHSVNPSGMSDFTATSAVGNHGLLFVGTTCQGAFKSADRGHTAIPINSWYTQGLETGNAMRAGSCSTTFTISAQNSTSGFRLFGWTGEGQLYVSMDDGENWFGPLLKGRSCEALKAEKNGDRVLVLASSRTESGLLMMTRDMQHFAPISLPRSLSAQLTSGNAIFDVAQGVLAAGTSTPGSPIYISIDNGAGWTPMGGVTGVTALVIDQETPDWIAAATVGRDRKAVIRVSDDRGRSFRTACEIEPPRAGDKPYPVTHLTLKDDGSGALLALTEKGAYLVLPDQKKLTH